MESTKGERLLLILCSTVGVGNVIVAAIMFPPFAALGFVFMHLGAFGAYYSAKRRARARPLSLREPTDSGSG